MIRQIDQRLRLFVGGGVGRAIVGWGEAGTGSAVPAPAPPDPAATTGRAGRNCPGNHGNGAHVGHLGFVSASVPMTDRQVLPLRGP